MPRLYVKILLASQIFREILFAALTERP